MVDDESPVPAREEVGDIAAGRVGKVTIIRQRNAGPAAARNTGLDHVPAATPYVAFLDSDDYWTRPFLSDAVHALYQGYDLFFGNTRWGRNQLSRFEWGSEPVWNLRAEGHLLIDQSRDLYQFKGDFFDSLIHRSSIISTSAMAYRFDRFATLRFDTRLFNGQDRLFKLMLGQTVCKVAFSPKIYADEGDGVGIFGNAGWGTEASLRFTSNYIALSKLILNELILSPGQRAYIRRQLMDARRSFAADLLHLLRHRKPVDWEQVHATACRDPAAVALFLPNVVRIAGRAFLRACRRPGKINMFFWVLA